MIALKDLPSKPWGASNSAASNMGLVEIPYGQVYDVADIPNYRNSNITSWSALRDEEEGDADGWARFLANTMAAEIGWRTVGRELLNFKEEDEIPYGKYQTSIILEMRNRVLQDSGINREIPYGTEAKPEKNYLDEVLAAANSTIDYWYYPMASYCYAYRPTNRTDLAEQFAEHNWFLPTMGEMMRLGYYVQAYYATEDSKFNIFKKPIEKGIIPNFSTNPYGTTGEFGGALNNFWGIKVYNGTYGAWSTSNPNKTSGGICRPMCIF